MNRGKIHSVALAREGIKESNYIPSPSSTGDLLYKTLLCKKKKEKKGKKNVQKIMLLL
jgi:hypothetical protein